MRIMKQKLILFLLSVTMPFCVMAAELGDDGLHKQSWMRDTFKAVSYTHLTLPTIRSV